MNDERLRALYSGAMSRAPLPEESVSLDAMMDVLERCGSEAERSRTLRRIFRDARALEEFELLRAIHRASEPPRRSWKVAVAWRVAAGLLIMAGTAWVYSLLQEAPEPMRGGDTLVTVVQPVDGARLHAIPIFVWQRVPDAVDYRLEVVDSSGTVVFEEQVQDTSSTGPMEGALKPGQQYRWWVTVLTRDARTLRSPTNDFRLTPP